MRNIRTRSTAVEKRISLHSKKATRSEPEVLATKHKQVEAKPVEPPQRSGVTRLQQKNGIVQRAQMVDSPRLQVVLSKNGNPNNDRRKKGCAFELLATTPLAKTAENVDQEEILNSKTLGIKNEGKQTRRRSVRYSQNKIPNGNASPQDSQGMIISVMEQEGDTNSDCTNVKQNEKSRKTKFQRKDSSSNSKKSKVRATNMEKNVNTSQESKKNEKTKKPVADDAGKDLCMENRNNSFKRKDTQGSTDDEVLGCSDTAKISNISRPSRKRQRTSNLKSEKNKAVEKTETSMISDVGKVKSASKRKASLNQATKGSLPAGSPLKRQRLEKESNEGKMLNKNAEKQHSSDSSANPKLIVVPETNSSLDDDDKVDYNFCISHKVVDYQRTEIKGAVDSDSESDVDWEEVEEAEGVAQTTTKASPSKKAVDKENLEISIKMPGKHKKKSTNQEDIMAYIARAVKRFKKEVQVNLHKVHLLTLVAHGIYRSTLCNDAVFKAVTLSCVPARFASRPVRRWDVAELTALVTWFTSDFPSVQSSDITSEKRSLQIKNLDKAEILVSLLRALGFLARLVMSFQPITFKVSQSKTNSEGSNTKKRKSISADSSPPSDIGVVKKPAHTNVKSGTKKFADARNSPQSSPGPSGLTKEDLKKKKKRNINDDKESDKDNILKNDENKTVADNSNKNLVESQKSSKSNSTGKSVSSKKVQAVEKEESSDRSIKGKQRKRKTLRAKRKISYIESENDSHDELSDESPWNEDLMEEEDSDSEDFIEKDTKFRKKLNVSEKRIKRERKSLKKANKKPSYSDVDDESKPIGKSSQKTKGRVSVTSSHSKTTFKDTGNISEDGAVDSWIEVYLPSEKKWNCIDLISSSVNHPVLCARNAREPVVYVLGFDNENCVKDVTKRYAIEWMSKTRKLRVDQEWWSETLEPYKTKSWRIDKAEDAILQAQDMERPLPTSITEYKNHPLYILKRHLLKFEAIYPETAATLGFCRNEAVYSRDCLHQLHTRETWLKEAKVVKKGEEPYKIVKGRKKRNQPNPNAEVTCELFGEWQTEDYKPPPAVDGKVPRNEYGNVEMFKPCMLPPGTVHIKIPGIQRVAKKLGIDCAQAVVGFDFHGGFTHPVIDGVIVCKEMEKTLKEAWRAEEKEAKRRAEERREKRVLGNWRHLVLSLRIRERLKRKYNTEEPKEKPVQVKDEELGAEMAVSWPLNVQEGKKSVGGVGHCHVFLDSDHRKDPVTGEWTKSCACGLTLPFENM